MKKITAVFLTLFWINFAHGADTYKFDQNHVNIDWSCGHFGFSYPTGKFTNADGVIILDEKNPQNSSVKVTIYTSSLNTGIAKFDEHLKSADFLDVAQFPVAKFESAAVKITGKKTAKVSGELTLHGITDRVVLDVRLNKIGVNPFSQKKTIGFSAETTIKRSKFGMQFGLPGISDEVKIAIEAEGILVSSDDLPSDIAWKIIPEKSSMKFTAMQDQSLISGSFKKFDGKINFDPKHLQESNVEIEIDTTSVDTSFAEALDAIQNAAWLATKAFPKAIFKATKFIHLSGKNEFRAAGVLTLKGKSVPVNLDFVLKEYGKTNAHMTGTATLRRNNFDIGHRDPKKANGIRDEIIIDVEVFAQK